MEFDELIRKRESVRAYDPTRPVPRDVLERVIQAGVIAPTAANRQPFKFLVVSSPAELAKIRPCYNGGWFSDAPHVLAVVGLVDKAWTRWDGYNALETDCTIAMDHMILAASNEGLGTCWIAAFDEKKLRQGLGLADNEKVFAVTPLGYPPAGYKPQQKVRRSIEETVSFL